jgi:hypothetical protein
MNRILTIFLLLILASCSISKRNISQEKLILLFEENNLVKLNSETINPNLNYLDWNNIKSVSKNNHVISIEQKITGSEFVNLKEIIHGADLTIINGRNIDPTLVDKIVIEKTAIKDVVILNEQQSSKLNGRSFKNGIAIVSLK